MGYTNHMEARINLSTIQFHERRIHRSMCTLERKLCYFVNISSSCIIERKRRMWVELLNLKEKWDMGKDV